MIWDSDENYIDVRWSDVQGVDEENITKANLIESLQKIADEDNFPWKVIGGLFDYYDIVPKEIKIKKIYFEVISNTYFSS